MLTTDQKPSRLLHQVKIDCCRGWTRLKFTQDLQLRQQTLVDKRSHDALSHQESAELDAIHELDIICDFINHQMAYQRHSSLRM